MARKEETTMSQRAVFIEQAKAEGTSISALCRAFGISRKTVYKWLKHY
jgi:transposase-like protein